MKKANGRIAIIHFLPLEYYPPITNFLSFLAPVHEEVRVYSTKNILGRKKYCNDRIRITRYPLPSQQGTLLRFWSYLNFNIGVFLQLFFFRPDRVLYYESYSSFPAYLFLKIFDKRHLYIHFHEYFDGLWYKNGMKLIRLFHQLEVSYLFGKAEWISQTNEHRLALFQQDYPFLHPATLKVIPNYPPASWRTSSTSQSRKDSTITRMVYIGSLSFEKTYIREIVEWTTLMNGRVTLDIYSYNLKKDVKEFLQSQNSAGINFFGEGIEYEEIPKILMRYDVGLVLYKGITTNYRFNATNKLFEYLACNLDVWFPEELQGIYPYISETGFPRVLKFNFNNLSEVNIDEIMNKLATVSDRPFDFFAEGAFEELAARLKAPFDKK